MRKRRAQRHLHHLVMETIEEDTFDSLTMMVGERKMYQKLHMEKINQFC